MKDTGDSGKVIEKYVRRALWMTNSNSGEFKLFFLEMVTEIRGLSGRDFNAEITLEDLTRAMSALSERFSWFRKITLNDLLKTVNAADSISKAGDLFAIASAVSLAFLSSGMILAGPFPYILLRIFAPGRLRCSVIMAIGGLVASELYGMQNIPELTRNLDENQPEKAHKSPWKLVWALFGILLLAGGFAFWYYQAKPAFLPGLLAGIVFLVFLVPAAFYVLFLFGSNRVKGELRIHKNEVDLLFREDQESGLESFFLYPAEQRLLFLLRLYLLRQDCEKEKDHFISGEKRLLMEEWFHRHSATFPGAVESEPTVEFIREAGRILPAFKKNLILCDTALWNPYRNVKGAKVSADACQAISILWGEKKWKSEKISGRHDHILKQYRQSRRELGLSTRLINSFLLKTNLNPELSGEIEIPTARFSLSGGMFLDTPPADFSKISSSVIRREAARLETALLFTRPDWKIIPSFPESVLKSIEKWQESAGMQLRNSAKANPDIRISIALLETFRKRVKKIFQT